MTNGVVLTHACYECGFAGDVPMVEGKATCPTCGTSNDVWLDGEEPPLNHQDPDMADMERLFAEIRAETQAERRTREYAISLYGELIQKGESND